MEVRYQDEAQKISLTGYADTLIMDRQQDKLVGIRVGGYSEVVSGLAAAICGGGTVTVSAPDGSLLCTAERGRYCKTMSREGAYAVATILWDQNVARKTGTGKEEHENEKEDDENRKKSSSQPQEYYLLCAAGDRDALYREIDRASTIPMIPQFADYLIDELQARGILTRCMVYTAAEPFEAWRLTCTAEDSNITSALARELAEGIRHENAVEDIAASFRKMAVLHPEKEECKTKEKETKPVPLPIRSETPAVQPLEQLSFWELAG